MDDLISRSALLENYDLKNAMKYGNETVEQQHNSYSTLMLYEIAEMIEDAPTVDAVPRDEYEALERRFKHLLKSDFIRSFDEYDLRTYTYKRDIAEADKVETVRHGKWEKGKWASYPDGYVCNKCNYGFMIPYAYCPHCGAKMDLEG